MYNAAGATGPRVWISHLTFSDGSRFDLGPSDIVVIVGPNNSGKSAALRAIRESFEMGEALHSPVLTEVGRQKEGTTEEVLALLDSVARSPIGTPPGPDYRLLTFTLYRQNVWDWWGMNRLNSLGRLFCNLLTADARLHAADPPQSIHMTRDPLTHPIHFLYRYDHLEAKISQQFRRAFGADLIVHRAAGNSIPLYVGTRPQLEPGDDRVSAGFVSALEALPTLQSQGDGMRSFVGTLLETSVGRESILLIDEPEAFLHPPQACLLGKMLVADKPQDRQIIIATHSGDLLRGIIDANSENVRVIRIRRSGQVNIARQLDSACIGSCGATRCFVTPAFWMECFTKRS